MGLHLLSPIFQHAAGAHQYDNAHIDNKIYFFSDVLSPLYPSSKAIQTIPYNGKLVKDNIMVII